MSICVPLVVTNIESKERIALANVIANAAPSVSTPVSADTVSPLIVSVAVLFAATVSSKTKLVS